MALTPPSEKRPRLLLESIAALVLAFMPFLSIAGVVIGVLTFKKAIKEKDIVSKIIAGVAIFVGTLMTLQIAIVLLLLTSNIVRAMSHS